MALLDLKTTSESKLNLADYENRDAWLDKVIVSIAKAGLFSAMAVRFNNTMMKCGI